MPAAQGSERVPLERVRLATALPQLDRPLALNDRDEEPARSDGGKLPGVADQDRLPLRLLDEAK